MPMIKCPECGKEVSDLADKCPNCGFPMGFESAGSARQTNNAAQGQQLHGAGMSGGTAYQSSQSAASGYGTAQKKKGKSKKGVIIAVAVAAVLFIVVAASSGGDSDSDSAGNDEESIAKIETTENTDSLSGENGNSLGAEQTYAESNSNNAVTEDAVETIAEYTLSDSIGWYTRHFIVVKNNSDTTVDISTSSLAYSEDGTMVGAANSELYALGSGCISVFYEAFETDKEIAYYETEMETSPSRYYKSVIQDLSYVQNDVDDGAVFQVTNNGEDAAEFVEGYALFFLGDELAGFESTYFTDDESEIKPGKTISKQLTSYEDFDRIEFYLTGRK